MVLVLIFGLILLINKKPSESKTLKEENYVAYVKINPLVKLDFKVTYYECTDKSGNVSICSDQTNEVTDVKLMNQDAKNLYQNVDLKGQNLNDATVSLVKIANQNILDIVTVTVTTNWNFTSDIEQTLKEKIKNDVTTDITVQLSYQETIDEQLLLADENVKTYEVVFDSNGGTEVEKQVIEENKTVQKPQDPTKEGYNFIQWQLDDKEYDFNNEVTSDITLKAKWEKITDKSENETVVNTNMINLNDNVEVTIYNENSGSANCFFYMFVTNLQEVFPTAQITQASNYSYVSYWGGNESDAVTGEIAEEGIKNNLSSLSFDSNNETKLVNLFKKYQNGNYSGIKNVNYTFENHRFTYSYDYLVFKNGNYTSQGESANTEIKNVLKNSTLFRGTCGGFNDQSDTILTEELCNQYNLSCSRW